MRSLNSSTERTGFCTLRSQVDGLLVADRALALSSSGIHLDFFVLSICTIISRFNNYTFTLPKYRESGTGQPARGRCTRAMNQSEYVQALVRDLQQATHSNNTEEIWRVTEKISKLNDAQSGAAVARRLPIARVSSDDEHWASPQMARFEYATPTPADRALAEKANKVFLARKRGASGSEFEALMVAKVAAAAAVSASRSATPASTSPHPKQSKSNNGAKRPRGTSLDGPCDAPPADAPRCANSGCTAPAILVQQNGACVFTATFTQSFAWRFTPTPTRHAITPCSLLPGMLHHLTPHNCGFPAGYCVACNDAYRKGKFLREREERGEANRRALELKRAEESNWAAKDKGGADVRGEFPANTKAEITRR